MSKKYDIYALGNALVDTEVEVSEAFLTRAGVDKGVMTLVDEARQQDLLTALADEAEPHKQTSGGSACNTVVANQYFGGSSYYACKVAADSTGDIFVNDLTAAGVDTNMSGPRDAGTSGKCLVMLTPDAERTMNTFLGISSEVDTSALDEDAIANSQYVYLEGYLVSGDSSRAATVALRKLAEKHGVKTALTFSDPAMVQFFKDGLKEMLGDGVDLLFCNEDEAINFTGTTSVDDALDALKNRCRSAVITLGANGAVVWDGERTHRIDPVPATAIDTNGAGDLFAGAFLYAITHGHDFPTAGKLAATAASQLVSEFGPRLSADAHTQIRQAVLGQ